MPHAINHAEMVCRWHLALHANVATSAGFPKARRESRRKTFTTPLLIIVYLPPAAAGVAAVSSATMPPRAII